MLRSGSSGQAVKDLQQFLTDAGYDLGSVDGQFGPKTEAAVRAYQADQGLSVDGVVGPKTSAAMGGDTGAASTGGFPDVNDDAAVAAWIEAEFAKSGASIATADETADARIARITKGLQDGSRNFDAVSSSIAGLVAGEGPATGVMAGGTIHLVKNNAGQADYYIVAYEHPPGSGHSFYYRFEDKATLEAAVGADWASMQGLDIPEASIADWTDGGDANEIIGITGSFSGYIDDITLEAAQKAGLGDPTRLGDALKNPEIALIMAKAAEGGWEDAQTQAALRNTSYYQNVWYPGIANFYGRTDNPEAAYAMYVQNVTSNLDELGVARDSDGGYGSTIAKMLNSGVTDTEFAAFTPTYLRAAGNDEYRQNVNKWLGAAGIAPLSDFNSFFDLLSGTSQPEVNEIVELAGISFVAGQQGTDITDQFIREIAERTDLTEGQIGASFLQSDKDLLGLGIAGLRTAGELTSEEIIATAVGFTTGDRSLAEMQRLIRKTKEEQGIADDPTATIFTDFNREGAPVKKGLQSGVSEGA